MNDYDVTIPETLPIIVYYNNSFDTKVISKKLLFNKFIFLMSGGPGSDT